MADQQFCLRWNNHQSTLISVFDTLLENGTLVDCTLAAEGQYLKAHKVVLSACSPYLEALLSQHYEKHPIVILKDVKFTELKSMMDYMYRGEVNISQDQLGTFLKAAESLQIKGLSDNGADGDARDVGSTPKAAPASRKTSSQPALSTRPAEPQRPEVAPESPNRSRDGSISPSSRKRRRIRRNSQGDDSLADSHLDTSNSCDLPSQAQSTPIVPNIPATVTSSVTTTPIKAPIVKPEQTELVNRIDTNLNSLPPESGLLKEKIEPLSEPLLEPKTEYLDDMNTNDSVEDLTLDDDDDMDGMDISNMSNMTNMSRPGPSHGNDLSNQVKMPITQNRPLTRRRYTLENMRKALDAMKSGISLTTASKRFGIPKSTLQNKFTGRYKEDARLGRPSVLTQEEEGIIVNWVISISTAGFSISKEQIICSASKLVKELNRPNPFTDSVPGEKWYSLFLKRHKDLSQRVAQALKQSRASVTEEQLHGWFSEVKAFVEEKGLSGVFKDSCRVFSSDETAFLLCPKGSRVVAKRGEKAMYSLTEDDKECLTVLVTANAAGDIAPPMVMFPYERVPAAIIADFPEEWGIGRSETGWNTGETFFEYITNVFHPWLVASNIPLPVVMFLDGYASHVTRHLSKFCLNNGIELIALYPNATHLLQPMDVAVFHPVKATWQKSTEQWRIENGGRRMRREEFAPLLKTVLDSSIKKETVINGFKTTGLIDIDPNGVNFKKLLK